MKNVFVILMMTITLMLTGCANGPLESLDTVKTNEPSVILPKTKMVFVGNVILTMGYGTTVPLTPTLSITASHVAKAAWKGVVAYNETCDIAIIRQDNSDVKEFPELGKVYTNETTYTVGKTINGKDLVGKGAYRMDAYFPTTSNKWLEKCGSVSITDAAVQEGMSGGAVVNARGELVGIISAMVSNFTVTATGEKMPTASAFISINYVRKWIDETLTQYYAKNPSEEASATIALSH